jgi:hypothetical protein
MKWDMLVPYVSEHIENFEIVKTDLGLRLQHKETGESMQTDSLRFVTSERYHQQMKQQGYE